jgi:hypothetical protein
LVLEEDLLALFARLLEPCLSRIVIYRTPSSSSSAAAAAVAVSRAGRSGAGAVQRITTTHRRRHARVGCVDDKIVNVLVHTRAPKVVDIVSIAVWRIKHWLIVFVLG